MIFVVSRLEAADEDVLGLIYEQRETLRYSVAQGPHRWTGFFRRTTFARALQGSNGIEGINASLSEAVAIVDDEKPESVEAETYRALSGYRNALTYVLQTHDDPYFEMNAQVIKSLHFMMLSYDLTKMPGQWRSTPVAVIRKQTGETLYEGPDAALVPKLMDELVAALISDEKVDPMVRGAMAHLNLTMIHPFKDGNGRMARALQTLVIARDGVLSPVFCSIEEWLGRNTDAYYNILGDVGRGHWHPDRDALPWIKFCLRAHFQQAATLIQRNRAMSRAFEDISKLIAKHRLPQRVEMALADATFGYRVKSGRYQTENSVSDVVASRDLRHLCELGLLEAIGEKRGRFYVAGEILKGVYAKARTDDVRAADPYEIIKGGVPRAQPRLPRVR